MPVVSIYQPSDLADVQRVFGELELGVDPANYPLPDFEHPLIRSKLVVRTTEGEFIGMAYTRAMVETALVLDPKAATRRQRMWSLWALHWGTMKDLQSKGYDRAAAFITPKPEGYADILAAHGWIAENERRTLFYNF